MLQGLQFRKSDAVVRGKGKAPTLADRDLGDHVPSVIIWDFTPVKQVQFSRLEQSFSRLLNFSAHSLHSGIGY
jgi:hypothetical protein